MDRPEARRPTIQDIGEDVINGYAGLITSYPRLWILFNLILLSCASMYGLVYNGVPDFDPSKGSTAWGTSLSGPRENRVVFDEFVEAGIILPIPDPRVQAYKNYNTPVLINTSKDEQTDAYFGETCTILNDKKTNGKNDVSLVFRRSSSATLLNPSSLKYMCEIDKKVLAFDDKGYDKQQFFIDGCPSRSLGNYISGYNNKSCGALNHLDVQNFKNLLNQCGPYYDNSTLSLCKPYNQSLCSANSPSVPYECWENNWVFDALDSLMDANFRKTGVLTYSRVISAFIPGGREERNQVLFELHNKYLSNLVDKEKAGVKLVGYDLANTKFSLFESEIFNDLVYIAIAFTFIFIIMLWHIKSLFVSILGYLQLSLSFPAAYGMYVLFGYRFFPFTNLLAMFVIFGIGVDDIFVIYDCWHQLGYELPHDHKYEHTKDMKERIKKLLLRSGSFIFATTFTTAASFLSLGLSSIVIVALFGGYCALVVVLDFTFGLSLFPAVLVIHEYYIKHTMGIIGCLKTFMRSKTEINLPQRLQKRQQSSALFNQFREYSFRRYREYSGILFQNGPSFSRLRSGLRTSVAYITSRMKPKPLDGSLIELARLDFWENAFKMKVAPFIIKHAWKITLVFVSVAIGIGINAVNLRPSENEDLQVFHREHPMERYDLELVSKFPNEIKARQIKIPIRIQFGIDPVEQGEWSDPDDRGLLSLPGVNFANPTVQVKMVEFCESLRAQPFYEDKCFNDIDPYSCRLSMCAMDFFSKWVQVPCIDTLSPSPTRLQQPPRDDCCGLDFPIENSTKFDKCIKGLSVQYYLNDELPPIAGFWFANPSHLQNYIRRSDLSGYNITSSYDDGTNKELVMFETFLFSDLTIPQSFLFEKTEQLYKEIMDFRKSVVSDGVQEDSGIDTLGFNAPGLFYFDFSRFLILGTFQSASLALVIVTIVVSFITKSPSVALMSVFTIFCITVVVGGSIVLMGWTLGVSECFILSVSIGLSVDFTIHYGESYLHCKKKTSRGYRVKYMLKKMGTSVTVGAFTTFVSGFSLSFTSGLIFYQFGVALMLIMSMSWLYSTFLLSSLLSLFGPIKSTPEDSTKETKNKTFDRPVAFNESELDHLPPPINNRIVNPAWDEEDVIEYKRYEKAKPGKCSKVHNGVLVIIGIILAATSFVAIIIVTLAFAFSKD